MPIGIILKAVVMLLTNSMPLIKEAIPLLVSPKYRKLASIASNIVYQVALEYTDDDDTPGTVKFEKAVGRMKNTVKTRKMTGVSDSDINLVVEMAVRKLKAAQKKAEAKQ